MLTRHINQPRRALFSSTESSDDCPMPFKYVDAWRQTSTNLDQEYENSILDVWVGNETDNEQLSEPWVGTVKFFLVEKRPKKGYMWFCGREARRIQDSPRPDYMWVEDWQLITKDAKLKQSTLKEWKEILKPRVSLARQLRQIKSCVQTDDLDDYLQKLNIAQQKFAVNAAPCM